MFASGTLIESHTAAVAVVAVFNTLDSMTLV